MKKLGIPPRRSEGVLAFLGQNVKCNDYLIEFELMLLAVAAGINDGATFADYHIFTSNQTGNTVLLAVGALGLGGGIIDIRSVAFSLALFVSGGCIFGQIGNVIGPRRRAWLLTTNIIQTALAFAATAMRKWVALNDRIPQAWSVITLLAFASGAQVAAARTVNVPEITTAMVTSAYIDFVVDPKMLQLQNRSRNRRLLFVLCLLVGSFIGSIAYKFVDPVLSFFLAALAKAVVCLLLLLNQPE